MMLDRLIVREEHNWPFHCVLGRSRGKAVLFIWTLKSSSFRSFDSLTQSVTCLPVFDFRQLSFAGEALVGQFSTKCLLSFLLSFFLTAPCNIILSSLYIQLAKRQFCTDSL